MAVGILVADMRAQDPARPPTRAPLVENDRVTVRRLPAVGGLVETMHITPQDVVAIQLEPGQIEMQIGSQVTKGSPGRVWYLPKTVEHALFNRGLNPVDMMVVMLANEPTRPSAARVAPGSAEARPTTTLIDNDRVSVMRVPAPAGMAQEMHKSPQDMLAIQSSAGQIEVAVGDKRTAGQQWSIWYLPKSLDHAVFNRGTGAAEMTVIAIK